MLDALTGWNEAETDRVKMLASLIRSATARLWNIQVAAGDRLTETELWPLPWDKRLPAVKIDDKQRKDIEDLHEKILMKDIPDGNSDIKS
jgi:hypothetical protein